MAIPGRYTVSNCITAIHARQVLDSRGTPTVEVEVHCGSAMGRAIVPSGASTGKHEALELRDGDPDDYAGKSVRKAVVHVRETLAPALVGMSASDQETIDRTMGELDGTPDKSRLGANAILGVSLACAHAAATAKGIPLWQYLDRRPHAPREGSVTRSVTPTMPLPMVNLISGGLHAGRNLDMQDFLFLPIGANSYSEALHMTVRVYRALSVTLQEHGYEGVLVGDEGGFGPRLNHNEQAIELILHAFRRAGLHAGKDAAIALDVASTHFFADGFYRLQGMLLSAHAMTAMLTDWADRYPILSIEDGMAEDDWAGWKTLTESLGQRVQLVGDDLFATNPNRLKTGIEQGVANSILIKVNQIGTLTETFAVIDQARAAGYRCVVSARSGETEDSTIADLAVATGVGQIKIGSIARSERLAKYNQLLRIEEQMGAGPAFARWNPIAI
ncbi:MAG: phosphopyruvate hydratase [Planctomycetes bacterium]|nr:phosphopyruvate hydratase [Planctomycetota bacterium]